MPPGPHPGFNKNVFINCPFDSKYDLMLRSILFTIIIWKEFVDFYDNFYYERKKDGFSSRDLKMMPVREYIAFIRNWLKMHRVQT